MVKIFITVVIIVTFVGSLLVFNSKTSHAPENPNMTSVLSVSPSVFSSTDTKPKENPAKYQITVTDEGLSVQELSIKVGDTVTFANKSSGLFWPAAGPHPTHTICPGFDALAGLSLNGTYSYTFTKTAACPFHDHLRAAKAEYRGKITVTE